MADLIDNIIAFENGEMTNDELRDFFQGIINDGTVWHLQGVYGRTATRLIEAGHCTPAPAQEATPREEIIDALGLGSRYDNEEGTSDGKPFFQVIE